MDASQFKATPSVADHPSRRLIAAGIRRGSGPLVVEAVTYPPLPTAPAARRRAIQLRGW